MTRAPRAMVGTGYRYTDLEMLRVDWFLRETRLSVREIAARLGRSAAGLRQHLYNRGIWVSEVRGKERSWAGV